MQPSEMTYTILTGGTSGIGYATAVALAKAGHHLTLFARNPSKALPLVEELKRLGGTTEVHFMQCDLNNLASVEQAARQYSSAIGKLDILINNAGGFAGQRSQTADGFESSFQGNYLGHFLLTNRLLPLLKQSTDARIINVSSEAHKIGDLDLGNLQAEKSFKAWRHYGHTKLMNALHTLELHKRYADEGVAAFSLHPGVVRTSFAEGQGALVNIFFRMPFLKTPEQGAATTIYLATAGRPIREQAGKYFKDSKPGKPTAAAISKENARLLWEKSEELLKTKGILLA